ncbi:hypothetical protein ACFL47_05320 [Candidatus Latescibacterota bacterium]
MENMMITLLFIPYFHYIYLHTVLIELANYLLLVDKVNYLLINIILKTRIKKFHLLTSFFISVLFILFLAAPIFALPFYTDPQGYPASWPSQLTTQSYTSQGQIQNDRDRSSDKSSGATPTSEVDFSSGPNNDQSSFFYYGDGYILYFRFRVNGPPFSLTGNGQPFKSATWNILMDTDGDGYKEFVIMLDGTLSQSQPDDIVVIYNNQSQQSFDIDQDSIWKQDSSGPNDGINGASGKSNNWDIDLDPYVWNFGRTRIVQIDQALKAGHNKSEYFIDIQVPLVALDASSIGGPTLTPTNLFSMSATTSNSNTDPTQKDLLYSGDFTLGSSTPLPTGDPTNPLGQILHAPIINTITSTSCPAPIILTTMVQDVLIVDEGSGQVHDSLDAVTFEYYMDINSDGESNDGVEWNLIGSASRSTTLSHWLLSWDINEFSNSTYLIRTVATDLQGNVTISTNQPFFSPSNVLTSVINTCSEIALFDLTSKTVSDLNDGEVSPGDTLTYLVTIKNTGGLDAFNISIQDTLPTFSSFLPDSAVPPPYSTDPALIWNIGTLPPEQTATFFYQVVFDSFIPDQTQIVNNCWITYNSGEVTNLVKMITHSLTISSYPNIILNKSVDKYSAAPGDTLTYLVTYVNGGTETATDVVITDGPPPSTVYVQNSIIVNGITKTDADDGDGVIVNSGIILVTIGTVPAGDSGEVKFLVTVP